MRADRTKVLTALLDVVSSGPLSEVSGNLCHSGNRVSHLGRESHLIKMTPGTYSYFHPATGRHVCDCDLTNVHHQPPGKEARPVYDAERRLSSRSDVTSGGTGSSQCASPVLKSRRYSRVISRVR